MSTTTAAPPKPRAVFTQGSLARHVLVMTATGSIGLMAVFAVDLLSILYISWLGDPALTAGVGYATQITFLVMSVNIGMSIGVGAVVSRAIGAGDRALARRLSASGLVHSFVLSEAVGLLVLPFRAELLEVLGARGETLDAASGFLAITLPFAGVMALGMTFSGVLRAVGDAKRAMYLTLFGAIVTAVVDPVLILGLGLGAEGAAITTDLSRLVWVGVGAWGAVRVHSLVAFPRRAFVIEDIRPVFAVAGPAMMTNIAAPIASLYSVKVMSQFGAPALAAGSIIDRIVPVAFGPLFAMSGVVGPIVGQNFGAGLLGRVRSTLTSCFIFAALYVAAAWALLFLASPEIVRLFSARGETADLVLFFCYWGAAAWAFLGCLFAANAAFNNLGYAKLSMAFNWGRATLGFMPFVTLGAHLFGAKGVILGAIGGAGLFGAGSIVCAYWLIGRLERPALANKSALEIKMS